MNNDKGYFHPQNKEYVKTSELVYEIADLSEHKILKTRLFNPIIRTVKNVGLVNKVFGDLYYMQDMSDYHSNYYVRSFSETVRATELKN